MNNINKITEGNAFALCIRQAVWHSIGGQIYSLQADELMDIELRVGQGSKATAERYEVSAEGDTIKADMPSTLKRGVYKTWLTAVFNGRMVSSNCEAAFEVVPFDVHYPAFAPAKIEGAQAVYLQGISMNDSELEAEKMRYKALIKQKEDEIAMLAKEREKLTNVALQLDGVDESLDGISETLDGVAKEDTQQEIKKAVDLIKTEISIDDKLSIRNAIELKGGQSVYKNPENPALLELAKNVDTIPQKFMTLEPEGVRYDDPIEWNVFNENIAVALSTARAFQNRIDTEGGIPSILYPEKRYRGFVMVEVYPNSIAYDANEDYFFMQFKRSGADAYLLSYDTAQRNLIEWSVGDDTIRTVEIDIDAIAESGRLYLFLLYESDEYTCNFPNIDYRGGAFLGALVFGAHPAFINIPNEENNVFGEIVQLNNTEHTDFRLNINGRMLYTRNKHGFLISNATICVYYLEQLQEINQTQGRQLSFSSRNQYLSKVYMPSLKQWTNGSIVDTYGRYGCFTVFELNGEVDTLRQCQFRSEGTFRYTLKGVVKIDTSDTNNFPVFSGPMLRIIDLPDLEIFSGGLDSSTLVLQARVIKINAPKLRLIKVQNYSLAILDSSNYIEYLHLPSLEEVSNGSNMFVSCQSLKRLNLPKLSYIGCYRTYIIGCPSLEEITLGNLYQKSRLSIVDGSSVNLIKIAFVQVITNDLTLSEWKPTNAINDTISTLVEDGEEFVNNREKFLWNFRNYIIAMLHDYSGTGETRTLTLHSMVANVLSDEDKLAITNKGWILSIV